MCKPARHLWGLVANGEQRDYESFDELYEDPEFEAIVSLSMASVDGFPMVIPRNLQMLTVETQSQSHSLSRYGKGVIASPYSIFKPFCKEWCACPVLCKYSSTIASRTVKVSRKTSLPRNAMRNLNRLCRRWSAR